MAFLIVMALSWLPARGEIARSDNDKNLTISVITCYPGPEIYELCGHSAIRVKGEGIDSVWNFGIFDFNQPNFIYRFVKGETDYKGMGYPFSWFLPEYIKRNSKVVEQDLNLTPEETKSLHQLLVETTRPENATYRYNYIKDNCSLRILDKIEESTTETIRYPDSIRYGTYRDEMRAYHQGYPWYQFGIDLALGSGLDKKLTPREEMFTPVTMERNLSSAKFGDGRPLVSQSRVLYDGSEHSVLPPTPFWKGPLFWSWILFLITCIVFVVDYRKQKSFLLLQGIWFFILGLAGILVSFLVFVSIHEATSPNVLIIWLNPLQFLFVLGILIRKLRVLSVGMAFYNIIAVGVLLIVWPFQSQSANPAFFPLMMSTILMALDYAIIGRKSSYNIGYKSLKGKSQDKEVVRRGNKAQKRKNRR